MQGDSNKPAVVWTAFIVRTWKLEMPAVLCHSKTGSPTKGSRDFYFLSYMPTYVGWVRYISKTHVRPGVDLRWIFCVLCVCSPNQVQAPSQHGETDKEPSIQCVHAEGEEVCLEEEGISDVMLQYSA